MARYGDSSFRGNKNSGDKPDSVKKAKWLEDAKVIEALKIERERAIEAMPEKIGKASYRDVVDSIDKTTKNIQLLGGKPTENLNFTDYADEQRRKIAERIIRRESDFGGSSEKLPD